MSTRSTIAYSSDFHLYEECGDNHYVHLRIDGGDWSAGLETATIDWTVREQAAPALKLKINVSMWRQIVAGWSESHWAGDRSLDHAKDEWNLDGNAWLENLRSQKQTPPPVETTEAENNE